MPEFLSWGGLNTVLLNAGLLVSDFYFQQRYNYKLVLKWLVSVAQFSRFGIFLYIAHLPA